MCGNVKSVVIDLVMLMCIHTQCVERTDVIGNGTGR